MNTEPIKHATFIVERTYPADAARIFRAFSDTDRQASWWFAEGEDWRVEEFTADFGRTATRRAASDMPMVRRSPTTPATWTSSPTNASCSPT